MTVRWFEHRASLGAALAALEPAEILVDVGCGIQPQNYVVPAVHVCCEPFGQYVDRLKTSIEAREEKQFSDRHYVVLRGTWEETLGLIPTKSVDSVFALDVIEHLEKTDGQRLLQEAERVARRQIAVFTPLGFVEQDIAHGGKDAWGLDGTAWQVHKSGWSPEDFDASWDIYASRDFHRTNNLDQPLPQPFGAIFAIKTMGAMKRRSADLSTRGRLHRLVDQAFDSRLTRSLVSRLKRVTE